MVNTISNHTIRIYLFNVWEVGICLNVGRTKDAILDNFGLY